MLRSDGSSVQGMYRAAAVLFWDEVREGAATVLSLQYSNLTKDPWAHFAQVDHCGFPVAV
jgi:hypothetical protein